MIRSCNCSGGLASTLEKRRKQSAVSSCQVCGGKQLVGRSPSKKMVSTVGLELTSVMNTDFTWKTVTKGNRSATRRARKPVANKESEVHSNRDRKVEDMPVSESEELGVKVLGRRFSDKIEHVPIKKRRFLIRSPSPPPRRPQMHSLQPDQTEQLVNSQSSLFQLPNSIAKNRACENVPEGNEDFSGISILAAAACSNSIEGMGAKAEESCTAEDSSLQLCSKVLPSTATCIKTSTSCKSTANPVQIPNNGNDSTVSPAPLEQTAVLTETTNLSQNLATHSNKLADGKNVEVPVSDISEPIKLNHAVDKDVGAGRACERFVLELDLNVPMNDNDWESFEDPDPKAQGNAVCSMDCGKEETFLSDLAHIPVGDSKNDVERTVHHITSDGAVLADVSNSADTRNLIPVTNESEGKLHNLDALTVTDSSISIHEEHAPSDFNNAPNALELKRETNFADKEKININVVVPAAVEHNMPLTMEDSSAIPNELSPTPCVSYGSGEDSEILSSHEVGKEDACSGNYCHTGSNYTAKLSSECIDEECPVDPEAPIGDCSEGSDSLKSLKVEKHHVSVPDTSVAISVGASQLSPNSEEMSTKHFVVESDEKLKDSKINTLEEDNQNIADLGASVHIETKEFFHKSSWEGSDLVDNHSNSSGKFALEEGTCNGSDYRSDAYHHDHGHTLGTQMTSEIQDGYDSQYEDGELREPAVHCWDEEFGDEGDAEHVDYGSDNRDTNSYDATADFSDSMPVQVDKKIDCRKDRSAEFAYVSSEVDQVQQQGVHQGNHDDSFIRGDAGKEESRQSIESRMNGGWDELPQRNRVSGENKMHPCTDGLDSKDSMVRSSRRDFQSRIHGPTSTYLLHRNGTSSLQGNRSNNFDDANCREERKFGYVKSIGRGGSPLRFQGRGRGGDRRVDPSGRNWGTNHHAPGYYSPTGFVQSGSKSAVVAAAKLESNGFVIAPDGTIVKARILGPSGRGRRRASPSDRAEAFSVHMGIGQMEARRSPDRSIRGRPVRYGPRVNGTGYRERYNGSAADGNIGSLRGPRPFDRRERSFSPNHRRGVQRQSRSHTRSRSRSRSRSPRLWPSPRGRIGGGPGFRQCSRSPPNFRYETRMNRMRSPHRRPNFGTDHIVDFSSTTRSRRSSPHSSRWINGRKDAGDHFREHGYRQRPERSSPERMFRRAQRFNLPDSPIRLRADEYYRPAHSGKFSEMVGADRGGRFDGSDDDRRIHSSKYGMSHPRRRYDADDTVKRFRYTMEDSFPVHNAGKDSSVFHGRGSPKAFVRNIDNRLGDGPRQDREENGHFRCARDVKFNVNSESTGMQDCDEEVAPATERSS